MKKTTGLSMLFLLLSIALYAQGKKVLNWHPPQSKNVESNETAKKISGRTAFLLMDINTGNVNGMNEEKLVEKYMLIKKGNVLYANSFIFGTNELNKESLSQMGVIPGTQAGNIYTGLIPVYNIQQVAAHPYVVYVQIAEKVELRMDSTRKATNVDKVHNGTAPLSMPYHGEGVVVGIIDDGFDLTNPNFYDTTGTANYRVKKVWFHTDNSGTPPTGYSYGTELTTMTAMLTTGTDDTAETHGTHVAGIAAGSGGYPGSPYKGVASRSDLVFVGTNFSDVSIGEGIEYIQDYASTVDKPCVINMSIGGHMGPHDGTSLFDRFCDGQAEPGMLLVGAAGNEGSTPLYLGHNYNSTDTLIHTFLASGKSNFGSDVSAALDIWGNKSESFMVVVSVYNTGTNTTEDKTVMVSASNGSTFNDTLYGTNSVPVLLAVQSGISPLNNKPNVSIEVDNTAQPDGDRKVLISIIGHNTSTKMWVNNAVFEDWGYGAPVYDGTSTHTVGEIGGTGNNMISVGAYTTKNTWTDIFNTSHNAPSFDPVGEIATFSSLGPTADGRTKPDIAAPGNIVASSMNSYDVSISKLADRLVDSFSVNGDTYYFVMFEGTSMATPMVTGILALWLQQYPELTTKQAISLMKKTAITDNFTGTIPQLGSNTWGWGKIDAFGGLNELINSIPARPNNNITVLCEDKNNTLSADTGFNGYQWTNGDSTQIINASMPGVYAYRVANMDGYYSSWSDTTVVHALTSVSIVSVFNDVLTSSSAKSYQWFLDNNPIPGATQQSYTAKKTGNYYVAIVDVNNCTNRSAAINYVPMGVNDVNNNFGISLYPNPAAGNSIQLSGLSRAADYKVVNLYGSIVKTGVVSPANTGIDIQTLAPGVYTLNITDGSDLSVLKFVKR